MKETWKEGTSYIHWGLHDWNKKSLALSRCLSVLPLSTPTADHLQCVLDGIREVLQRADGDGLLRRVLAGAVWLCQEGDNHLYITLGSQCSWLQKWLTVVNTTAVHVHACGKESTDEGEVNISTDDTPSPKHKHGSVLVLTHAQHLRASTLSRALATPSRFWKKSSSYTCSVSGPTRFWWLMTRMCGFIWLTAAAAVSDFDFWVVAEETELSSI